MLASGKRLTYGSFPRQYLSEAGRASYVQLSSPSGRASRMPGRRVRLEGTRHFGGRYLAEIAQGICRKPEATDNGMSRELLTLHDLDVGCSH